MNVIKRSGKEVSFNENKIYQAILKANDSIEDMDERLSEGKINKIVENVMAKCNYLGRAVSVEEIQDYVEEEIMREGAYKVAKSYITYRYKHELIRKSNTTVDHDSYNLGIPIQAYYSYQLQFEFHLYSHIPDNNLI